MEIEVETFEKFIAMDMLEKRRPAKEGESVSISQGDSFEIPEKNAKITYEGSFIRKSVGFPEIVNFGIVFGSGVTASIVANWLYDKFKKNKVEKLTINRKEINLDKGEIQKIIEEEITEEVHS